MGCVISQLKCGKTYSVTVTAFNAQGSGPTSTPATLTTAPCQPQNVTINMDCSNSAAHLNWGIAPGALSYLSVLKSPTKQYLVCNSTDVSCQISSLPCGEVYDVEVTAVGSLCTSAPSFPIKLYAVPCVPSTVQSNVDCGSNVVTVTWTGTQGAVNYTSVVTGPQGEQYYCQATSTSCSFPQLSCGLIFNAAVIAVGNTCNSTISTSTAFYTVPCQARNISIQVQCGVDHGAISWNAALGGINYTASISAEDGQNSQCNASGLSCLLYGITCGHTYNMTVQSFGSTCSSISTSSQNIQTAPCVPQNVAANVDCQVNNAALSWSKTPGASNYTASVVGPDGQYTCNTTSTTCGIPHLNCGLTYNLTVTAFNAQCQGQSSNATAFITAPCAPDKVVAQTDCGTGSVALSWSQMANSESFTSYLMGSDGVNTTCNSTGMNCTFPGLPCGHEYNASVYAINKQCAGPLSQTVKAYSASCVPLNVANSVDCTNNSVLLSWDNSMGAINYTSSVISLHGDNRSCYGRDTSCQVQQLLCGEQYTTVVTSHNGVCRSGGSMAATFKSVPCPPVNLGANVTFGLVVTFWAAASGAGNYTATVTGDDGNTHICHSSNTSCVMSDLMCGHNYSMTVTTNGEQCSSTVSQNYSFKTAPCAPQNLQTQIDCVTNSVTVSWNSSLGADYYTLVAVGTNGEYHVCNSTGTSCVFTNLTCGLSYVVNATASNDVCSSDPTLPIPFITAPCVPVLQPPELNCNDNSVSIYWNQTLGAVSYVSNVTSPGVQALFCQTENTSCIIRNLTCGQNYSVTVTAINAQGGGPATAPLTLITAPCQPQNVITKMNCQNSSTLLSWDVAPGALRYQAILMEFGVQHFMCNSTGQTCEIPALPCGKSYNVTVTAFNGGCQSSPSSQTTLCTVPCVPNNLTAAIDCGSNSATLSWSSSLGAVNYTAVVTGPNGDQQYCVTTNLSCSFTQLSCGLQYSATITSMGKVCSSSISPASAFQTVPCIAGNIQSQFQCGSDHALVSWGAAAGGLQYTATLSTVSGESSNCSTTSTQCTVSTLQCGRIYNVTVQSYGAICSSTAVSQNVIQTQPCVPQNVIANIDCQMNAATLNWNSALGSDNYTALMSTPSGEQHTCNTSSTSCVINNLSCGLTYNISITSFNAKCQGGSNHDAQLTTAPCTPQQVHAVIDCITNNLLTSWNQGTGVDYYTAYLIASDGGQRTCDSSQTNCTIPTLPCGQQFNVTVAAANSNCGGPSSNAIKILTAPCVPGSVNTAMDCVSNSALVSWSQSSGALNYTPALIGPQGDRYNCSSQTTSCWVQNVPCGEDYTVAVVTQNEVCSSTEQNFTLLQGCSCSPKNLTIFYSCNSDVVKLYWTKPTGSVHFTSTIKSSHGNSYTCETTNSTCDIGGLQCGESYNVTVTAFNTHEVNVSLGGNTFQTAPCTTTNITAQLHCGTSTASMLWSPAQGASSYGVVMTGTDGWSGTCTSNTTTCDIDNLQCGHIYSVTLTASNSQCNTVNNQTTIYSAPCAPQNVRTLVICGLNTTDVSWDTTPGAINYTVTVQNATGNKYFCNTSGTSCSMEHLQCGQTYSVTVTANGDQCKIDSATIQFHTDPCVPKSLTTTPTCAWDFVTLSWAAASGADYYTGMLTDGNGTTLACNTTATSCDIRGVQCGYNYSAAVIAYNDVCSSGSSLTTTVITAPCVPTNVVTSVSCSTQFVTVTWASAPGALTYSVTANSGLDKTSFLTSNTSYELANLLCDSVYEVSIISTSAYCNSHGNISVHVKTIPCPPQILSAYASCDNNSGIIQWNSSQNARSYLAVVKGVDVLSCNTSNTICEIPHLQCGQNYTATLWAEDGTCTGRASSNVTFKTVPCIAQNINYTLTCQTNSLNVSWGASSGATAYSTTAVGTQGQTITSASQEPSCLLTGLQCGNVYNLTVLSLNNECKSNQSAALQIKSVPCSPVNLTASTNCNISGGTAFWGPTAGALSYMAMFSGPDGDQISCMSSDTSCSVSGLHCGVDYNVTVTAFDNTCQGVTSNIVKITTAPCKPTNLVANIDCASADLINVTWTPNRGAVSYVVTASGYDGHTLSCNTTTNTCNITGVRCGNNYTVSVTSWNSYCSSETVSIASVESVPCRPDSAVVNIDCLSKVALVSWPENNLYPTYHTAIATDSTGKQQNCSALAGSCNISNLECGLQYSFQVYSINRRCSSLKSIATLAKTAPCQPQGIQTTVQCDSNDGIISWAQSTGAMYYIATLTGNGSSLYCNTTTNNCSYKGLQCGQTYNASIVAMDDKCASVSSAISTFPAAPCQPQGFNTALDCGSQTVSMSWGRSDGAKLYSVQAESNSGAINLYSTSNVFYQTGALPCGWTYGFTVMAIGDTCNSSQSYTLYQSSAPCVPVNVTYTTICPTTTALVMWSASGGATGYQVTANEHGGLQSHCNSTSSNCTLAGLDCGLSYNVQVVAVGQKCSSNASSSVLLNTAPCVPNNTAVQMTCGNNSATMSWGQSRGAQSYFSVVTSDQNVTYLCDTTSTSCNVSNLTCGSVFSFSVLAKDMHCNSSFTEPAVYGMVPCPPDQVETTIYRKLLKPQEVEVSWNGSHCGTDYMATVQGQIGNDPTSSFVLNSYWTTYMDFYIPVPCSSSYNVTVTSRNAAGESYPSTSLPGYTAPCPPQVQPLVVSGGNLVISWQASPYADEYRVVQMDNNNTICTTPGLACQVSFTSSSFQVIAVNPSGESNPILIPGYNEPSP
ncbi:mucin-3B-like [Hyperolius riggenbachi]|uniref:mucin-3B-like n=1 Tax=Hyperolius riggenbachi TaxID=752182 RepID=UPI0035A2D6E3